MPDHDHYYSATPQSAHKPQHFSAEFGGKTLRFETDAGVFSRAHLDPGTLLLAQTVPEGQEGHALDIGCGWGALSILTHARSPQLTFTLCDINTRALALCRKNLDANRVPGIIIESDGLANVTGSFQLILTNPPIRAGKAIIYKMFADAAPLLAPDGALYIVIRKQQGAPSALKYLKTLYRDADVLAREGGYWILRCAAPMTKGELPHDL